MTSDNMRSDRFTKEGKETRYRYQQKDSFSPEGDKPSIWSRKQENRTVADFIAAVKFLDRNDELVHYKNYPIPQHFDLLGVANFAFVEELRRRRRDARRSGIDTQSHSYLMDRLEIAIEPALMDDYGDSLEAIQAGVALNNPDEWEIPYQAFHALVYMDGQCIPLPVLYGIDEELALWVVSNAKEMDARRELHSPRQQGIWNVDAIVKYLAHPPFEAALHEPEVTKMLIALHHIIITKGVALGVCRDTALSITKLRDKSIRFIAEDGNVVDAREVAEYAKYYKAKTAVEKLSDIVNKHDAAEAERADRLLLEAVT